MGTDWARIDKWAAIFKDPVALTETIAKNFVSNYSVISADMSKIASDEVSGNYNDMGVIVAQITTDLLGKIPASASLTSPQSLNVANIE